MPTRKKSIGITRQGMLRWTEVNSKLDRILQCQESFSTRLDAIYAAFDTHTKDDIAYQKHIGLIISGDPEDEDKVGISGRLKSLEQTEDRREKHIWFMYTTLIALVAARLSELFKWISSPLK